jgi:hypothetical protein
MAYDDFMHGIGHLTDREDKNAFWSLFLKFKITNSL